MKPVREIIGRELIDDLWGCGYTILPRTRHPDPFHVPPEMVPSTRSYQWMHLVHDRALFLGGNGIHSLGWSPVPASRHDGYFMPAGHVGDIEVSGLGLFEKPKFEVEAERQANIQKSQDAADPAKFFAGKGFSGSVTVGHQDDTGYVATKTDIDIQVDKKTKTINTTVAIPKDMLPHMAEIFAERDRLAASLADRWNSDCVLTSSEDDIRKRYFEAIDADPDLPKGPTLNALVLPLAINNIRSRIKEEASNGD